MADSREKERRDSCIGKLLKGDPAKKLPLLTSTTKKMKDFARKVMLERERWGKCEQYFERRVWRWKGGGLGLQLSLWYSNTIVLESSIFHDGQRCLDDDCLSKFSDYLAKWRNMSNEQAARNKFLQRSSAWIAKECWCWWEWKMRFGALE